VVKYCWGEKKGDICTPNRGERRRGKLKSGSDVGLKTLNRRWGGGKIKKNYFRILMQMEKLHLPLHPGSQGTESRKEKGNENLGRESGF